MLAITLLPAIANMAISSTVISLAVPSEAWRAGPYEAAYRGALVQYSYCVFVWSGLAVLFAMLAIIFARKEGDPIGHYMRLPEDARGKLLDALLALALAAFGSRLIAPSKLLP